MSKGLPVVQRLLVDLGIEQLVIVDDEWRSATLPTLEAVLGAVQSALLGEDSPERQRVVAAFADLGISESGDSWRDLLIRRWKDGDDSVREALEAKLVGPLSPVLTTIASWFGEDGPNLVQLTPERWNAEGKSLLDGAKGSVICLFDENLGAERKGTSLLLAALAEKRPEDQFFFGLLTGTIERSSEETRTATLKHDVKSDRVIAIAKDRTTEPTAPSEFADGLRIVVQATFHAGLRRMAKTAIDDALAETTNRLDGLTVADFDRIVLETAQREGTWEADELLRLIGIWERSERRTQMLAKRAEIERFLARIRVARPVAARLEPASPQVRELRRFELHAAQDINEAYLPIELGDVFSLDEEAYVLMVQPCDMVVRKGGIRGRDPWAVPLVAIVRTEGGMPNGPSDAFYHLEYYESSPGKEAYIDFRKMAFLPLAVLDLVSFRLDGNATIDPSATPPTAAFASMQKLFRTLAKTFKVVRADVAAAEKLMATEERVAAEERAAAEKLAAANPARGQKAAAKAPAETEGARLRRLAWAPYTGDAALTLTPMRLDAELRFGLRRVGRILPPHAATALTRFHQWRSRPAFEADFAREYPEASPSAAPATGPSTSAPEAS